MSSFRFEAPPRKRQEIENTAWAVRQLLGFTRPFLPVLDLIEFGLGSLAPGFHYDIAAREEMGERHGAVDCGHRLLLLREDVYAGIAENNGRDRFTGCHEVGHVLLHGGTLNRVRGSKLPVAFRSPEWQANAFAGAVLMPEHMVRKVRSVTEMTREFGVTVQAARTRLRVINLSLPER